MKRLVSLAAVLWALVAAAELPPLIPRDVLLGNPEKMQAGSRGSFILFFVTRCTLRSSF